MNLLEGIKVVDFSKWLPGQYCGMLLGDYGADVIKIEDLAGDATRKFWPEKAPSMSYWHLMLNRNKRGVALNIKKEGGREVLAKLLAEADVFLEGFRPGYLARYGLDYETIHKINPRLVYCSITGFGQNCHKPAHDLNVIGLAGLNSLDDVGGACVSEVQEAFFKLLIGVATAIVLLRLTQSVSYAAGGAILGVTCSCLISGGYLASKFRKAYATLPESNEAPRTTSDTAKALLTIAVPITIGSAGLQFLSVLEAKFYMGQLLSLGNTQAQADTMKGIYNMTQTIFNMPCSFIPAITMSIIPAITSHITLADDKAVCATEESASRITGLIAMPCAVGLFVLAEPVTALIGGYEGANLTLAAQLMALMGIGVFFYSIVQLTNAVMQAHGHASIPVVNMLIAGVARLIIVYLLTGNPAIQLLGAPIGAALCYLAIGIMNLVAMRKVITQKPAITKNLLRPLIPSVIMGIAAFGAWLGLKNLTDSRLLLCAIPVMVGALLYFVLVIKVKAITRDDCLLLPKGEKIAKLLRL